MTHLPKSEAFRRSVSTETRKQFAKSMRSKLAMLVVAIVAIAAVVRLDAMKAELRDTREKKYGAAQVAAHLKHNPVLAGPAERLAKKNERYATPDEVFNAILAETSYAADLATATTTIRDAFAARISKTDQDIRSAVTAEPAQDAAALKARRAELIAARTAELTEAEQSAAEYAARLRRAFDQSNVVEAAKSVRVLRNEEDARAALALRYSFPAGREDTINSIAAPDDLRRAVLTLVGGDPMLRIEISSRLSMRVGQARVDEYLQLVLQHADRTNEGMR